MGTKERSSHQSNQERARMEIAKSEARFSTVAQSANDAIITADNDGVIIFWNRAAREMFGYAASEVMGQPLTILMPGRHRDDHLAGLARYKSTGHAAVIGTTVELAGLRKDGAEFPTELSLASWSNEEGRFFSGIIRDITRRRQAELTLAEAERRYRNIFEHAVEGIFQTTPNGEYLAANPALARMYGYESSDELLSELADPEHMLYVEPGRRQEFIDALENGSEITGFESEVRRRDGRKFWISECARAVRDANGEVQYYEGTVEDITRRKKSEEALRESEQRFRKLFEQSKDAMFVTTPDGVIVDLNEATSVLFGNPHEGVIGTRITHWVEDHEYQRLISMAIDSGTAVDFRIKLLKKDGTTVDVLLIMIAIRNDDGESMGMHGVVHDLALEASKPPSGDIVMDRPPRRETHASTAADAGQSAAAAPDVGVLGASGATEFALSRADPINLLKFHTWLRSVADARITEVTRKRKGDTVLTTDLRRLLPIVAIAELPYILDVHEDASGLKRQGTMRRFEVTFDSD